MKESFVASESTRLSMPRLFAIFLSSNIILRFLVGFCYCRNRDILYVLLTWEIELLTIIILLS